MGRPFKIKCCLNYPESNDMQLKVHDKTPTCKSLVTTLKLAAIVFFVNHCLLSSRRTFGQLEYEATAMSYCSPYISHRWWWLTWRPCWKLSRPWRTRLPAEHVLSSPRSKQSAKKSRYSQGEPSDVYFHFINIWRLLGKIILVWNVDECRLFNNCCVARLSIIHFKPMVGLCSIVTLFL